MSNSIRQFEAYLSGRIKELIKQEKASPADCDSYSMARSELQYIYDNILPKLRVDKSE